MLYNISLKETKKNIFFQCLLHIYFSFCCRKGEAIRNCVEKSLLSCNDPTPSNVVNSLLLSMRNATPCKSLTASYTAAATGKRTIVYFHKQKFREIRI